MMWTLLYIVLYSLSIVTVTSVEKLDSKFVSLYHELIPAKLSLKAF
jgi:hypothetical protein